MNALAALPASDAIALIAEPGRTAINASRWCVVVAHPDDETIGCGALLARLRDVSLVLVTDGAPRDLKDARTHGFQTAPDYARHRSRELMTALASAGIDAAQVTSLGIPDQGTARTLEAVAHSLEAYFAARRTRIVLTHAYEGGHPDHDATCFAVHAARRMLGPAAPQIVEMPFYHEGDGGMVCQLFAGGRSGTVVPLTESEAARKRAMIAAHASQAATLAPFRCDAERFRPAPPYDFTIPPNHGRLLYERMEWGLSGREWSDLARAALAALALS